MSLNTDEVEILDTRSEFMILAILSFKHLHIWDKLQQHIVPIIMNKLDNRWAAHILRTLLAERGLDSKQLIFIFFTTTESSNADGKNSADQ